MRKTVQYLLFMLPVSLVLGSCTKWLDVKPQDKFTDVQIFSSKPLLLQAMNGIYLSISKNTLYGDNLTMSVPELLAQNYNIPVSHSYTAYASYNYADATVAAKFSTIWENAYAAVANANIFLQSLNASPGIISPAQDSVLRGEAIALRAYLQFDVLRLFGPMYNSSDSTLPGIPYYTKTTSGYNPYLPANAVMDSITADLLKAEQLLANDPVILYGVKGNPSPNEDPFFQNRNLRMNYYAVKALQARVYMYRGDKVRAYAAAQTFIQSTTSTFPWVLFANVITNKANPDRIFSTELVFSLQCLDMYSNYSTHYDPGVLDANIFAPLDARLTAVMESATYPNDYRLNPCWIYPNTGTKTYRTFYKYADVSSTSTSFRYTMPMIRKSEMYYIAAECAPDNTTALGYLNTVRLNRGLPNLTAGTVAVPEILKEYQKEFYGEGQLFYYYKRTNASAIPTGSAASGNITMDKSKYVLPLPLSETGFH
ncbi:MAG: RagB/SusD family nutrient uptake outer membrane protein [Bacteroidota bacterium]